MQLLSFNWNVSKGQQKTALILFLLELEGHQELSEQVEHQKV